MKLKNPTLVNKELYERVEEIRVQKTLIKILLVVVALAVVFIAMNIING